MPAEEFASMSEKVKRGTGGAVGAGLVLVVLPCLALFAGMDKISKIPLVGLPLLAIFGIMILFGSLALTSTLFARLGLEDRREALALPNGSVRAAIALSLIVLFAIIAIMLHQSVAEPYKITGLSDAEKTVMVRELSNRVVAVRPELCPAAPVAASAASAAEAAAPCVTRYEVHVLQPRGQESTDLAKQLLILIGTLMTSVTSFYFASRTSESAAKGGVPPKGAAEGAPTPASAGAQRSHADGSDDEHKDGCDVAIADPTPDEDLPATQGGVA